MFAIRHGDWKLIEGLGSGGFTQPAIIEQVEGGPEGQLYNLAVDPSEKTNLYQDRPDVVERLARILNKTREADTKQSSAATTKGSPNRQEMNPR
jgi:arylsulfatase A-like enzyme